MKQRTLFDSFSKNTPKSTTPPQAPTVEIVDVTADSQADGVPPTAETTSKSAATTNIPTSEPSKTDATPPQIIALVDIPDPHLEDIQEVVEIQDHRAFEFNPFHLFDSDSSSSTSTSLFRRRYYRRRHYRRPTHKEA